MFDDWIREMVMEDTNDASIGENMVSMSFAQLNFCESQFADVKSSGIHT